ncbi:MAG: hypothetical protein RIR51_968 [Bacteroidota bacterium]|jgi:hypothetical protein
MQILWGVKPTEYNHIVNDFNQKLQKNKFLEARLILENLEKRSIFTVKDLDKRYNLIQIKIQDSSFVNIPSQQSYIKALIFLNKNNKTECLANLREAIKQNPTNQEFKKLYEYLITENNIFAEYSDAKANSSNNYSQKEALAILELMKRKEKYIKYD